MRGDKPFDHEAHCRALELAEEELRRSGKDALAATVGRARSIHFDMQTRVYTAHQQAKQIEHLQNKLESIRRTLLNYTCKADAPWIGTNLFPEFDPDTNER